MSKTNTTERNESKERITFQDLQNKAIQHFMTCCKNKQYKQIPCVISEIPDIQLWSIIRAEILSHGTLTESQAELCCSLYSKTKSTVTVYNAIREQIIQESKQLFLQAYQGEAYVFVKIHDTEEKDHLMLFELAMLVDPGFSFSSLSADNRAAKIISDST